MNSPAINLLPLYSLNVGNILPPINNFNNLLTSVVPSYSHLIARILVSLEYRQEKYFYKTSQHILNQNPLT